MEDKWTELLIRAMEGELPEADRRRLDAALAVSPELRHEQEQLLRLRRELAALKPAADAGFVDGVMDRLSEKSKTITTRIVQLFPRIAAASVLLFLVVLLGIYLSEGTLSTEVLIGTQDLLPQEAYTLMTVE